MKSSGYFEIKNVVVGYDEFRKFLKCDKFERFTKLWRLIGALCLCFVLAFILFLEPLSESFIFKENIFKVIFGIILIIVVMIILPWFVYPRISNNEIKKSYDSIEMIRRPQSFILSEEGIEIYNCDGYNAVKWDELHEIKENLTCLAVYISKYQMFLIPKKYIVCNDTIDFMKEKACGKFHIIS